MRTRRRSAGGFTLLEVLLAATLLALAAGALLYSLGFAYQHYRIAWDDWGVTLELWNRSCRWRAGVGEPELEETLGGTAMPLRRVRLEADSAGRTVVWEVLHARP